MTDEQASTIPRTRGDEPKSILELVRGEEKKARRDATKASVKVKYSDLIKARAVVQSIEKAIVEDLMAAGEDEAGIRAILSGE